MSCGGSKAATRRSRNRSIYTHGNLLRAHCQARLDAAQARIEAIVTGADGKPTGLRPFDEAGGR